VVLPTTTLGLYGGVLWSGEFQGFIIHELVPTPYGIDIPYTTYAKLLPLPLRAALLVALLATSY
jgi:hypothetical protein